MERQGRVRSEGAKGECELVQSHTLIMLYFGLDIN